MSGVPLRYAARILAGQSPDSGAVELLDRGLPFLQGNAEFGAQHPTARWESASAPKVAEAGDVLVSVRAPVGAVNLADQRYGIGRGLCAIRPHTGPSRYFYWWLVSSAEELNSVATGSTFAAVSASDLAALLVPVADETQQAQIADYLDRETAEIDAFIADQEELIGLLTERRASTIESAFDSAPQLRRLRSILAAAVTGPFGTQLSADEYVVGGVPVINPIHIKNGRVVADPDVTVSSPKAASLARFAFKEGDIALGRKGEVDKSALIDGDSAGAICGSDSMMIRPDPHTNPRYLWWFFQSSGAHGQLTRWAVGSTVVGLNQNAITQLRVPYGDKKYQACCVSVLDERVRELDAAIADAREAIALSKERRAALISAAVTGKIDVRGAV